MPPEHPQFDRSRGQQQHWKLPVTAAGAFRLRSPPTGHVNNPSKLNRQRGQKDVRAYGRSCHPITPTMMDSRMGTSCADSSGRLNWYSVLRSINGSHAMPAMAITAVSSSHFVTSFIIAGYLTDWLFESEDWPDSVDALRL